MHENLEYCLRHYSPTFPPRRLDHRQVATIRKIYPPSLAELVTEHG